MKLFEITQQFRELEKLELDDDIPPEVIRDTLEGLTGDFTEKAVQVAKFALSLESHADAIAEAAKAMSTRAGRMQKRADAIRSYLLFQMQLIQQKRIETPELVIARQTNPPSVQVTDEHGIPDKFWVQPEPPPRRIDKKAIKEALQSGETIDGAYLEQGESLRIKV